MSVIASLGLAISAGATTYGNTGPGEVTQTDTSPSGYASPGPAGYAVSNDGLGVPAGAIKHVWVIVMENHAFETNFTGLSNNPYTSKTLPQNGALLTNYYGTGHSSLDNYISTVSGQAPILDDQDDCPAYTNISGSVSTSGSLATNGDYGQLVSAAGANAPAGDNGCVYPSTVPTLFNQLDAANKTWKVYAQDFENAGATTGGLQEQNAGVSSCGAPNATPGATPSPSQTVNPSTNNPVKGSATATDAYVAKHNPLPWFQSILGSGDCSSSHVADLFGPSDQLSTDLQTDSSTPSFSYIVPNNCSNGHDAVCTNNASGANITNNLSGGFTGQTPNTPTNDVGGSYSADLFLQHVIPEIQESPAYADGGLIAVVWDEAYPQFTYSNDTQADSPVSTASAFNSLSNDAAGETLYGRSLNWEPSGPNTPNIASAAGQEISGGPGYGSYVDRPGAEATAPLVSCAETSPTLTTLAPGFTQVPTGGCYDGQAGVGPGGLEGGDNEGAGHTFTGAYNASTGVVTETTSSSTYSLVTPNEQGDTITLPTGVTTSGGSGTAYVGAVSSHQPALIAGGTDTTPTDAGQAASVTFQLVDGNGNPVTLSGGTGSGVFQLATQTASNDPLYDVTDPTPGGGDTGAILLSPYIKGGTVSNTYYNHYSLLRSLEDIFQVSGGASTAPGYTGSIPVNTGVDGLGHLGYAGQPGLAPFGTDVFTGVNNTATTTVTNTVTTTKTSTIAQTVTAAGQTLTTPGAPYAVTVRTNYALVPSVKGDSYSTGHSIIDRGGFHLGKVSGSSKAKKGYTVEIASQSPKPLVYEQAGSDVSITLKYVKNKK